MISEYVTYSISRRFQDIAKYWSNVPCW